MGKNNSEKLEEIKKMIAAEIDRKRSQESQCKKKDQSNRVFSKQYEHIRTLELEK